MPIQVTCQKCHKRFNVSDQFAGKTGPCPNCKATIRVPDKSDEVVIEAPEAYGPQDAEGKAVLKPIEREEVEANPVWIVGIVGSVIVAVIGALALRFLYPQSETAIHVDPPMLWWILAAGSFLLAPPLVYAGYWFLRNDELEPHKGRELAVRVLICATLYATLWGLYALMKHYLFPNSSPEMFHFAVIGPVFIGIGGVVGLATMELDFGTGAMHYVFYLLVTVLFCFLVGVPAY